MTEKEARLVGTAVVSWWLFWVAGGALASWVEGDWGYLNLFGMVATGSALLLLVLIRSVLGFLGELND